MPSATATGSNPRDICLMTSGITAACSIGMAPGGSTPRMVGSGIHVSALDGDPMTPAGGVLSWGLATRGSAVRAGRGRRITMGAGTASARPGSGFRRGRRSAIVQWDTRCPARRTAPTCRITSDRSHVVRAPQWRGRVPGGPIRESWRHGPRVAPRPARLRAVGPSDATNRAPSCAATTRALQRRDRLSRIGLSRASRTHVACGRCRVRTSVPVSSRHKVARRLSPRGRPSAAAAATARPRHGVARRRRLKPGRLRHSAQRLAPPAVRRPPDRARHRARQVVRQAATPGVAAAEACSCYR